MKLFGREGRLVSTIGRAGDGPGEFRSPMAAARVGDDRLAVFDAGRMYVSIFGPDGAFEYGWHLPGIMPGGFDAIDNGTRLLIAAQITADHAIASPFALHMFDLNGNRIKSFRESPHPENPGEAAFMTVVGTVIGSTAKSVHIASNQITIHNISSGIGSYVSVGNDIYRSPNWPASTNRSIPQIIAWANQQMWTTRLIAIDSTHFAVRFLRYGTDKEELYQYAIVHRDGTQLASTAPSRNALYMVSGKSAYTVIENKDPAQLRLAHRV